MPYCSLKISPFLKSSTERSVFRLAHTEYLLMLAGVNLGVGNILTRMGTLQFSFLQISILPDLHKAIMHAFLKFNTDRSVLWLSHTEYLFMLLGLLTRE